FAAGTLYAFIPTALVDGGMTDWAVRRLLEYRRKLSDLWVDQGFGTAPDLREIRQAAAQEAAAEEAATGL
ncbi:MAG: hypothetical protein EA405_14210, partial [Rhodospirillales bacterium]